ncbi:MULTISPECIES: GNAT family N-acetyltransferase [unclassified Streptomyces]|uniref:GNAT family N-acetyltransferase n=1 Tax=unclassified Streptomyces TaxID=2593676 RepID=UPI002E2F26E5|nr:GNAT family N-acetyltransferase [Streptomyces sp. NBC_01268]
MPAEMPEAAKLSDGVVTLLPSTDAGARAGDRDPFRSFGIRAGRCVGSVGLRFAAVGLAHGDVDVTYRLHPEARGRGFATRAVLLACAHARCEGARRAVIQTPADDPAAAAVARRAGFLRRGQISHRDGTVLDWYVRELDRG